MNAPRMRVVRAAPSPAGELVNANESRSVVASDNHTIARAQSILIGIVGHPGRLSPEQADDVMRWHAGGAA